MKRLSLILILVALLLSACDVIISVSPSTLRVLSASYSSNYRDTAGKSYICDNRQTVLSYQFSYQGELRAWRSYLQGEQSKAIRGDITLTPSHPYVQVYSNDRAEVSYIIDPFVAPLSQTPSPQAIVVVPNPVVIGYSTLKLDLYGYDGSVYSYSSTRLPVVSGC